MKKLITALKLLVSNPKIFLSLMWQNLFFFLPDRIYLKVLFRICVGYFPNFKDPKTFNEKLQWIKLYNRRAIYSDLVDKYVVKSIVARKIGQEYVVPLYGVWNSFDDIDFSTLPAKFVLKCTHDSSGVIICKDKKTFNCETARTKMNWALKFSLYKRTREWPYKNVPHRIIAEQLLEMDSRETLIDYKFWCFNGVPQYMYCTEKSNSIFENFYDMDFVPVDINHGWSRKDPEFIKPEQFETMKELACILSQDLPFVRIDFYQINNKVYFGEYTFFDWAGLRPFITYEQDLYLGSLIDISKYGI